MKALVPLRRPAGGLQDLRRWRRALMRRRRWLAAGCTAAAVTTAVQALAPPAPATERVPVAARDLAAGRVLTATDVVTATWPRGTHPDGVLATPVGRILATAVRRGEPLTDTRVTGPGLLAGQPAGAVAVAVRLGDPAATVLLAPGCRIDLLGGPTGGLGSDPTLTRADADLLAADVLVLAVPGRGGPASIGWFDVEDPTGAAAVPGAGVAGGPATAGDLYGTGAAGSGVVVVAADHQTAARLAGAAGARSITAVLTR
jgi:Flp pilus assembly protein CpaB